mmetsp:Transcript_117344/g.373879  ORF Transcript_117344/g.373879 Transcript_117344/m.373879 type:complete len:130 (+) Transcript_117344:896-1285(+)
MTPGFRVRWPARLTSPLKSSSEADISFEGERLKGFFGSVKVETPPLLFFQPIFGVGGAAPAGGGLAAPKLSPVAEKPKRSPAEIEERDANEARGLPRPPGVCAGPGEAGEAVACSVTGELVHTEDVIPP